MTTISTSDDLLTLLQENKEFHEAVRKAILTEELMSLPAVFSAFASEVRADIKILKDGQKELQDGQKGHTDDIGELKGLELEAKFYRRGSSLIATLLGVRRIQRVSVAETDVNSQEFTDEIDNAMEDGVITSAEHRRVFDTDTIMKSARRGSPNPVYTVVECSYSLNRDDIQKVKTTATILGKVFPDAEIHAALYHMNVASFIEEEAKSQGVHLIKTSNLS